MVCFVSIYFPFNHILTYGEFPKETVEDLGIYIVSFDRPGYGESDPNPKRTVKGMASDIEELADQLGLGHRFYVIGFSMGGQVLWSCLKYIPHRYDFFSSNVSEQVLHVCVCVLETRK